MKTRDPANTKWPAHAWQGDKGMSVSYSPRKCCGWSEYPRGVKGRTEHVARESGERLMVAALVVAHKCCPCAPE